MRREQRCRRKKGDRCLVDWCDGDDGDVCLVDDVVHQVKMIPSEGSQRGVRTLHAHRRKRGRQQLLDEQRRASSRSCDEQANLHVDTLLSSSRLTGNQSSAF